MRLPLRAGKLRPRAPEIDRQVIVVLVGATASKGSTSQDVDRPIDCRSASILAPQEVHNFVCALISQRPFAQRPAVGDGFKALSIGFDLGRRGLALEYHAALRSRTHDDPVARMNAGGLGY
jgi:hypothetical protein